jgi:hypothetical protein
MILRFNYKNICFYYYFLERVCMCVVSDLNHNKHLYILERANSTETYQNPESPPSQSASLSDTANGGPNKSGGDDEVYYSYKRIKFKL